LQSPRRAAYALGLLNAGLVVAAWGILRQNNCRIAGGMLISAGLVTYAVEMRAILRRRKRKQLDWGLRCFLTAQWLLAPVSAMGLVLAWPGLPATLFTTQLESAYGYLALMGVLTLAILGMSYKILPFLVWYHSYAPLVGRNRVPALGDMYSTRLQAFGFFSYLLGLGSVCIATALGSERWVGAGGVLVVMSLVVYGTNVGLILRHFWKPQVQPLAVQQTPKMGKLVPQDL
jgi:hypothetical protein